MARAVLPTQIISSCVGVAALAAAEAAINPAVKTNRAILVLNIYFSFKKNIVHLNVDVRGALCVFGVVRVDLLFDPTAQPEAGEL
jgi:hypothetical protein